MSDLELSKHIFHSPAFEDVVNEAVEFFIKTPPYPLPPSAKFLGAGVYALYFVGQAGIYAPLGRLNQSTIRIPIYVGKTSPTGWRTGRGLATAGEAGNVYRRLNEHAKSVQASSTLNVRDFVYRFIILAGPESGLIGGIEAALIRKYSPLWNSHIDGFGNHDPGSGRYNQSPSEWDILHPGRTWATRLTGQPPSYQNSMKKVHQVLSAFEEGDL
ncbi:MAG: Eco29kI family restriction endonuclease [Ardenticatenales bacterium]|nr:Eco29kI family restriction endonuclease [Ardenticatenales bacterium]